MHARQLTTHRAGWASGSLYALEEAYVLGVRLCMQLLNCVRMSCGDWLQTCGKAFRSMKYVRQRRSGHMPNHIGGTSRPTAVPVRRCTIPAPLPVSLSVPGRRVSPQRRGGLHTPRQPKDRILLCLYRWSETLHLHGHDENEQHWRQVRTWPLDRKVDEHEAELACNTDVPLYPQTRPACVAPPHASCVYTRSRLGRYGPVSSSHALVLQGPSSALPHVTEARSPASCAQPGRVSIFCIHHTNGRQYPSKSLLRRG
ncbi:hypothetical protein K466DRAFT_93162 [Polyporus arcularius HHB13444]|uniref:Uncharacterized protein n=1 Tax=Polyporus arcularius HHB13444 TaxID=1314778 RepID=A0A5C3PDX1_9APHY|nr:hypothetical protein K466DRAFT_93162 [Polyporus arcularius HHB13444]